ncbi:hypothetical protein OY671_009107, partial [Metschnikowia pulcherrima]
HGHERRRADFPALPGDDAGARLAAGGVARERKTGHDHATWKEDCGPYGETPWRANARTVALSRADRRCRADGLRRCHRRWRGADHDAGADLHRPAAARGAGHQQGAIRSRHRDGDAALSPRRAVRDTPQPSRGGGDLRGRAGRSAGDPAVRCRCTATGGAVAADGDRALYRVFAAHGRSRQHGAAFGARLSAGGRRGGLLRRLFRPRRGPVLHDHA